MAIAGHASRKMIDHYSHIRMEAKRAATDAIVEGELLTTISFYGVLVCLATVYKSLGSGISRLHHLICPVAAT
jgi:hypothetical protein